MKVVLAGIAILLVSVFAGAGIVLYLGDSPVSPTQERGKQNLPHKGDGVTNPPPALKIKPPQPRP